MTENGFREVPRKIEPGRFEYWHNDVVLVWAGPSYREDGKDWTVHLGEAVVDLLPVNQNTGSWFMTDIYKAKEWVAKLGPMVEAYLNATDWLTAAGWRNK